MSREPSPHDDETRLDTTPGADSAPPMAETVDSVRQRRALGPVAMVGGIPREIRARLGTYLVEELVGRGAIGAVYRARQEELNRPVALKILLQGAHASKKTRLRFLREAQSMARLRHPNIVSVHEVGEYEGQPFFTMDYIDGMTLDRFVQQFKLSPRIVADLCRRIAEAADYAHRHGIIHRDLKPSNILIDSKGEPIVTDFGLAKELDEGTLLSVAGDIMGTPAFMAPEQAEGRNDTVDARADVYALGTMVYTLITRKEPFQGKTMMETLNKVIHDVPPALTAVVPGCDEDLAAICTKAMEKDPDLRYATAGDLARDLGAYVDEQPVSARPWSWQRKTREFVRRRKRSVAAAAIMLAVGILAVGLTALVVSQDFVSLSRQQLGSGDAAVRRNAVEALAREVAQPELLTRAERQEEAVALLLSAFRDPEPQVTHPLLKFLATYGHHDQVTPLLTAEHRDWIMEQASSSPDPARRSFALAAAGRVRHPQLAEFLIARLNEPNPALRLQVVRALGNQRSSKAIGPLINLTILDPICRAEGEAALEKIYKGGRLSLFRQHDRAAKDAVRKLQEAMSTYNQRIEDVLEPGQGPRPATVEDLYRAALASDDPDMRLRTVYEIGSTADPELAPILWDVLGDDQASVGAAAAYALARLLPDDQWPAMHQALKEGPLNRRSHAVLAVGFGKRAEFLDELLVVLAGDQQIELRRAAATALGELGDPRARPGLEAASRDPVLKEDAEQALLHL